MSSSDSLLTDFRPSPDRLLIETSRPGDLDSAVFDSRVSQPEPRFVPHDVVEPLQPNVRSRTPDRTRSGLPVLSLVFFSLHAKPNSRCLPSAESNESAEFTLHERSRSMEKKDSGARIFLLKESNFGAWRIWRARSSCRQVFWLTNARPRARTGVPRGAWPAADVGRSTALGRIFPIPDEAALCSPGMGRFRYFTSRP